MSENRPPTVSQRLRAWRFRTKLNIRRAVSRMRFKRLDDRDVPFDPDEIRLFTVMRNESLRLPYFLEYYFDRGVDRIFVVDNGSTDGSASLVLDHDRTHVIQTHETYTKHTFWIEALLDQFGLGHWCIAVDADEFFVFPGSEQTSIRQLVRYLDEQRYTGVRTLLLDMFSDKTFDELSYEPGDDPLRVCPYFDTNYERQPTCIRNRRTGFRWNDRIWTGGARKRVFAMDSWASKVPLFRFAPGISPYEGTHLVAGVKHADVEGALLHFKYLQTFPLYVRQEVERGQHWNEAADYKRYENVLADTDADSLYWTGAERYVDTQQLIDLSLMTDSPAFRKSVLRAPPI